MLLRSTTWVTFIKHVSNICSLKVSEQYTAKKVTANFLSDLLLLLSTIFSFSKDRQIQKLFLFSFFAGKLSNVFYSIVSDFDVRKFEQTGNKLVFWKQFECFDFNGMNFDF